MQKKVQDYVLKLCILIHNFNYIKIKSLKLYNKTNVYKCSMLGNLCI